MSNRAGTLYIGVTNSLERRVHEHKTKLTPGFTSKYKLDQLLYYETYGDVNDAIDREKKLKGWLRTKKVELIESFNPLWADLSEGWYPAETDPSLRSG